MMSGFCAFPATERQRNGVVEPVSPSYSHEQCKLGGCPCSCHLGTEEYECGNCKFDLREAPRLVGDDDEMVFVHIDPADGRSLGEMCP